MTHRTSWRTALVGLALLAGCDRELAPTTALPGEAMTVATPTPRTDLIRRGDAPLTLASTPLDVGAALPDVSLVDTAMAPLSLAALRGQVTVLSVVPSIDTRVCEVQTHRVSDLMPSLPPGVIVMTVSRDLPFAQRRFAEEASTQTRMASDYKGGAFGRAMGLDVVETGLLARSVWVIDAAGKVAYRELVADQSTEPDYDALAAAVARAAAS
ncbi:MAG: thiol peroxidase [Kofleriaceae bacterium]